MRQHHYNFAHRVLPHDVASEPGLWTLISSDKAASYLQVRWNDAAAGTPESSKGLIWIAPVTVDGIEIRLVRMPPPSAMSETHYAAIARAPGGAVRYFVAEQGDGRVYMAEWRQSMRMRYDTLVETADAATRARLGALSASSAPWEVSASSIPGLPYAASFIAAVATEICNAAANSEVAKAVPARTIAKPGSAQRPMLPWILLGIVAAVLIALALLR